MALDDLLVRVRILRCTNGVPYTHVVDDDVLIIDRSRCRRSGADPLVMEPGHVNAV